GLDEEARRRGADSFAAAGAGPRQAIVADFAGGRIEGGAWSGLNVTRAFAVVMRATLAAFYAHPWAWNEIGFGGPAYPRGYAAFGSDHLGDREQWEPIEAFSVDPVKDTKARGIE